MRSKSAWDANKSKFHKAPEHYSFYKNQVYMNHEAQILAPSMISFHSAHNTTFTCHAKAQQKSTGDLRRFQDSQKPTGDI